MADADREQEAHRAYWLALGAFVDRFALTETVLYMLLSMLADLSEETAFAILSGVRIDTAMQFINRILEFERISDLENNRAEAEANTSAYEAYKKEITYLFTQLGKINKTRNLILHYGSHIGTDKTMIGNFRAAMVNPYNTPVEYITPATLENMTADLGKIGLHLLMMMELPLGKGEHWDAMAAEARRMDEPWRYKPRPFRVRPPRPRPRQSSI